jgi:hypothetical protein
MVREILRRMYGHVVEQRMWRIRNGQGNLKEDVGTCGRTRNVENKN